MQAVRTGGAHRSSCRLLRIAAALLLCACASARADDDATQARLPAITVTAQKTPQDEREVPLSIAVVGGEQLQPSRIDNLDQLSRYAANTQFSQLQFYVRGVGTGNTYGFDPSVGIFIDGVYLGRSSAGTLPLWDLQQVEVIRGPQGTLLGKNTVGGALNLSTVAPGHEFSGEASALSGVGGNADPYGLRAAATLPWGNDWALRLSALASRSDGYIDNTTLDSDELGRRDRGLRARLAWTPTGAFNGWLSAEHNSSRVSGIGEELSAATPTSLALYRLYDPATEADPADGRAAFDTAGTGAQHKADSATLNLAWAAGDATVTSLANIYRSRFGTVLDVDYSPLPLLAVQADEDYRQWSEELRVSGAHGDLDYLVGVYASGAHLGVDTVISSLPQGSAALASHLALLPEPLAALLAGAAPGGLDPLQDHSRKSFRQQAESGAAFGQATLAFADGWSLTGGLRWTYERKRADIGLGFDKSGLLFREALGQSPYQVQRKRSETDLAPKLALQYAWSRNLNFYAAAARGYKSGGYNDFAATAQALEFQPEHSNSVELGVKSLLDNGALALDLALFETGYRNIQVNAYDGSQFYVQNAASARIRGAELASRWRIGGGFSSLLSLGWLDARYLSFANAPQQAEGSGSSQDLSGARMPRAPRESGSAGLEYSRDFEGAGLRFAVGIEAQYRAYTLLNLDNDPADAQPGYTLYNARLELGGLARRWTLRANLLNAANHFSRNNSGDVPLFAGNHSIDPDPLRRGSLTLEWAW